MYRQTGSPYLPPGRHSTSSLSECLPSDESRGDGSIAIDLNRLSTNDVTDPQKNSYSNRAFEVEGNTIASNGNGFLVEASRTEDVKEKRNPWLYAQKISKFLRSHRQLLLRLIKLGFLLLYNIYLGFAIHLTWTTHESWCQGSKLLLLVTAVVYLLAFIQIVMVPIVIKPLALTLEPYFKRLASMKYCQLFSWGSVWTLVFIFLIVDTRDNRYRLISVGGLMVLLLLGFVFSASPQKVNWRHVQWGVLLQFVLSLIILRWSVGREIFSCLGDKVKVFLDYTDVGSEFVFGYLVSGQMKGGVVEQSAIFAFKVLNVILFFSFMVSILYYYGLMQALVMKVGWFLQQTIGTTACESVNAAGNIFLGQTEAPLLIKPYLPVMTKSELHAVMTGGFATIAGSIMAAYITFGVNASHLMSASVMSAPAALAFSKLVYPETEESVTKADNIVIEKPTEANVLEAATNGVSTAIGMVANIAANLVAFVAFIALLDGMFAWFGSLINLDYLSFEWLLSKLFVPLSYLMGVELKDTEKVAQLIGIKTVLNELLAYKKLATFQKEKSISPRSEAIATFALCGFSNITSIGIQIGGLGALAPKRKSDVASVSIRAMLSGSAACFMTACVAGALLTDT